MFLLKKKTLLKLCGEKLKLLPLFLSFNFLERILVGLGKEFGGATNRGLPIIEFQFK